MRTRSVITLVSLFALFPAAHAADYDASAEFSNVNNPSGPWSYGWLNGSTFQPFPAYSSGPTSVSGWRDPGVDPFLGIYDGPSTLTQHPGGAGQRSVLRFKVPASGLYTVAVDYSSGPSMTTDYAVSRNGSTLASGVVTSTSGPGSYLATLQLDQGDVLDSLVGTGGNGNANDSTPVAFRVSQPVPEPATLCALGVGSLALLRKRLRA